MSTAPESTRTPLFVFDLARATAAVVVVFSHARDLILLDASEQPALSPIGRVFYALSGLGHQAVIVFFVISGFLVTRGMLRASHGSQWSLSSFALARLTRLWVVLLPCLLLGAAFDHIGLITIGHAVDIPAYGTLASRAPASPPALDCLTLLGNALFLQTIAVKPYGSNGALWSLANEAWYYVIAALAYDAWRLQRTPAKAIKRVAALALILSLLPPSMLALAPVWACGACLAILEPERTTRPPLVLGSIAAFVATLALSRLRVGDPVVFDILLGVAAAWLLRCGLHWNAGAGLWPEAVRIVSRRSYSLYLSHLPLLALVTAILSGGRRQPFTAWAVCWVTAAVGLGIVLASAVWWCFERHTALVRALFSSLLTRVTRPVFGVRAATERGAAS